MKKLRILFCTMLVIFFALGAEGSGKKTSHSILISIQYPNMLSLKKSEIHWEIDQKQKKITVGRENKSNEKNPRLRIMKSIGGQYAQQTIPRDSEIDFITALSESEGTCKYGLSVIDKPNRDMKDCIIVFTMTDIQ